MAKEQRADDELGELILFPGVERTCFVCPHHGEHEEDGGLVSWCEAFDQQIDSEAYEAEDCSLFSVDNAKVQ